MKLLECIKIEKTYVQGSAEVRALRGVTLAVNPGEFVCISGRSGSGKTTLLHCIGTLETVTKGSVILEARPIQSLSESALLSVRRRTFGFVFQEPRLFRHLSVMDNVALPFVYRGKSWCEARRMAVSVIEEMGLSERAAHDARLLSGGEAERVAIARAIVHAPKILIADEPTGELDNDTSKVVVDLLARQVAQGMTVIVASHDKLVEAKATCVLHLEDGVGTLPEGKSP